LTRLDAFLNTLEPNSGPTDEKGKLQMVGRELRGSLAALRLLAARNGPRGELRSLLEEVNTRFDILRSRFVRASRQNPELDSFRFHDLRDALEQLRRAIA
jgi:hypothetical protein